MLTTMHPACRAASRRQVCSGKLGIRLTNIVLDREVPSFSSQTHATVPRSQLRRHSDHVRIVSTRTLHSSAGRASLSDSASLDSSSHNISTSPESQLSDMERSSPLAVLPLITVIRSLITTTISSSPALLPPSLAMMSLLAHTKNPLLNPDANPVLGFVLKKTFYAQFCAGENAGEVRQTMDSLKNIGFSGVILGYAREVVLSEDQTRTLSPCGESTTAQECIRAEVESWAAGTLETVRLAAPGDFVALKFTGAGRQALFDLTHDLPPSPALADATDSICRLAASRGVRLLFDAEQQAVQAGIDDWTLHYMRKYNTTHSDSTNNAKSDGPTGRGRAVVYGTYQAYLKATPTTLSRHMVAAADAGFTLGVKLVRGAYLGSDPRHLMHDTKADTDAAYDGIAEALLRRRWMGPLADDGQRPVSAFPDVDVVVATHNRDSVRMARGIVGQGNLGGEGGRTEVAFAQLQGMADEISCELVSSTKSSADDGADGTIKPSSDIRTYKYLVWGSTGECMKYLLRRAQENRDAVSRTRSGRDAMRAELWRRIKSVVGMG